MRFGPIFDRIFNNKIDRQPIKHRSYRIFTDEFDEVVEADDLHKLLVNDRLPSSNVAFEEATELFREEFLKERFELGGAAAEFVRWVESTFDKKARNGFVVSFLIDHSGSMKGLRMLSAVIAVEAAVDALRSAEIRSEVLGFTTTSWRGGKSRRKWQSFGSPTDPGRLCDLRHIIYKSANAHSMALWRALDPSLLKENIDGEALLWAASRIFSSYWTKRIICVVSDGAPVDDSTLASNRNKSILINHLNEVELILRKKNVTTCYLDLGGEYFRQPEIYERAGEPLSAGRALLALLHRTLNAPLNEPDEPDLQYSLPNLDPA